MNFSLLNERSSVCSERLTEFLRILVKRLFELHVHNYNLQTLQKEALKVIRYVGCQINIQ